MALATGRAITVTLFVAFAIEAISGLAIAIQTTIAVAREVLFFSVFHTECSI